jgi:hypothetical protein
MVQEKYIGVVQKVFPHGAHGPYAKARSEQLGSVTFALDPPVWREAKWPDEGMCVVMTNMLKKRAGWRADSCRFMRPEDQEATETTVTPANTDKRRELPHG